MDKKTSTHEKNFTKNTLLRKFDLWRHWTDSAVTGTVENKMTQKDENEEDAIKRDNPSMRTS